MDFLINLGNILKVLLGLSFVILIHELGHFLLAKWNDVRVDRFSIGFPPKIFSFRKGETEYVLAALLFGGYVSLHGEGPDDDGTKSTDPRAFSNKSVGARMAIMSAGVIMNLILGLICFVYAYGQGMEKPSPTVGVVVPGSPAYLAGLRPGDKIVGIDGRHDIDFNTVLSKVRLGNEDQLIQFELERPGLTSVISREIRPRREPNAEKQTIGIAPSHSMIVADPPYARPAGAEGKPDKEGGFEPGDKVIAVGPEGETPTEVGDALGLRRLMARYDDKPLTFVVARKPKAGGKDKAETRATATLPPNHLVDFGFRLKAEPVVAVRPDSIADKAGFRKGDLIIKVNDGEEFDPMRLPSICFRNAGKPMTFEVERRENNETKTVTLTATPDDSPPWGDLMPVEPLDVPGLGLAYPVRTTIAGVTPGSPAAKAGLKAGDVINAMTIPAFKSGDKTEKEVPFKFGEESPGWASAFQYLQETPVRPVSLTVNHATNKVTLTPVPEADWYYPSRGVNFLLLTFKLPPMGPSDALRHGFDDTVDNILNIYAMLRSLATRRLPLSDLAGPITIARVAYYQARSGLTELIHFLGILSINLAVLNFLPIPPLDGGQMVYLAAEGVRGRPIQDAAKSISFWTGVVLVLALMGYVLIQDVLRW